MSNTIWTPPKPIAQKAQEEADAKEKQLAYYREVLAEADRQLQSMIDGKGCVRCTKSRILAALEEILGVRRRHGLCLPLVMLSDTWSNTCGECEEKT